MLPYILSGGSVDQQDVAQDTSILITPLEDDQTYVDVVPLHNVKPTETEFEQGTNYVRPTTNEQEIKLVTLKTTTAIKEKPIYLLGNMALDSGILGEQEAYTPPTKGKPGRPTTTTIRQKLTTLRPTLVNIIKEGTTKRPALVNVVKEGTTKRPSLVNVVKEGITKRPTLVNIVKEGTTKRPSLISIIKEGTTMQPSLVNIIKDISASLKNQTGLSKPTLYIPMSPSLLADKENQNKYGQLEDSDIHGMPAYVSKPSLQTTEITKSPQLVTDTTIISSSKKPASNIFSDEPEYTRIPMIPVPVISADKVTTSTQRTNQQQTPTFEILPTFAPGSVTNTLQKVSHPSKVNIGPIGGFKIPGPGHKPSTLYRPIYEPTTKPSIVSLLPISSRRPIYETVTKESTASIAPSTNSPAYEPSTKTTTVKIISSTQRPVYEPVIKTSTIRVMPSENEAILDVVTKPSIIPLKTSFSRRPVYETSIKSSTNQMPTTIKDLTPVFDIMKKPTTPNKDEVTRYPVKTQQTYTTGKASSPTLEIVTKPTIQIGGLKMTKHPINTPTTEKTLSPTIEILTKPSIQKIKYPSNMPEIYTTKEAPTLEITTQPTAQGAAQAMKNPVTDEEIPIQNEGEDSSLTYVIQQVTYPNVNKLPSVTTDSVTNKDSDKIYTYVPLKTKVQSETLNTSDKISKKPTESTIVETVTPIHPLSTKTNVVTVIPNYEINTRKSSTVSESSEESELQNTTSESVTSKSKGEDESKNSTEESVSEHKPEESTSDSVTSGSDEKDQSLNITEDPSNVTDASDSYEKSQSEGTTQTNAKISDSKVSDESQSTTEESKSTLSELESQDQSTNATEETKSTLSDFETQDELKSTTGESPNKSESNDISETSETLTTDISKSTPEISKEKQENEPESVTEDSKTTSDDAKLEEKDAITEESLNAAEISESTKKDQPQDTTEESFNSSTSKPKTQAESIDTTEDSLNRSTTTDSKFQDETNETTEESQNESEQLKTESEPKETTEESESASDISELTINDELKESTEESVQLPVGSKITTQVLPEVTTSEKVDETKLYSTPDFITEDYKPSRNELSKPEKNEAVAAINKIAENPSKQSFSTVVTSGSENELTNTPVYEKLETITANVPSTDNDNEIKTTTPKRYNIYNKNKEPVPEDEISTVKVIPVYDDDIPIYTLPSGDEDKVPSTTVNPILFGERIKPQSQVIAENSTKFTSQLPNLSIPSKTTQIVKPEEQQNNVPIPQTKYAIASTPSTIDSTRDTALPGLEETFNNYMKEHYDPKLSTTGNYDEISQMTTFPTPIYKEPSSSKTKIPTLPTTQPDFTTTNMLKYQTNEKEPQITTAVTEPAEDFATTPIVEKVINSKPTIVEPIETVSENTDKPTALTTKYTMVDQNNTETPIIYLDLKNPDANTQTVPPKSDRDNINNSSLTRIKIKNPVNDVEKIIFDAPPHMNTPPTVQYTLPSNSQAPNIIASGLIAGYPTYSQEKNTDYVPTTTMYKTIKPSTTKKPVLLEPQTVKEAVPEKDKDSQTTVTASNDKKTILVFTATTSAEESSTYEYPATETPTYEPTQIPLESLPISNEPKIPSQTDDQINSSFVPPLEKISDLINQLQNSPSEHDSVGYDYSNGIATTIVPLEKFKNVVSESSPTTKNVLSTIIDKVKNTQAKLENNTYVVLQTLPSKLTTRPYLTTLKQTILPLTTKAAVVTETTIPSRPKIETTTGPTTILSIIKQSATGRPYVTSTYSTTKGFLDKIQSTIDKSAGRINLEEEKNKLQQIKPTEIPKYTTRKVYSTMRRPTGDYLNFSRKVTRPPMKITTITIPEYTSSKATVNVKDSSVEKWTLIPQRGVDEFMENKNIPPVSKEGAEPLMPQIVPLEHSSGAIGLDESNKGLDKDVAEFLNMCNELSFKFWTLANSDLNPGRSVTLSPFGMISTLAMIFLGARGLTSNQMNDILKLDDVVTFNPHLVFQNITDTVTLARGQGIENAAFVRALFADRLKVRKIIPFYKEQAQQFYEGAVVDINFSTAGEILKRRTNLLIRKQTGGRIKDFVKAYTVPLRSPLTALSANVFQTSCDSADASSEGRDGEMYFAVAQTVKQRKLVPIPAIVWRSGVSAGYEPSLDATAVAIGDSKRPVSLIMVMPGQQGVTAPGDNLERLEQRLFGNPADGHLEKLLKVIVPRRVELQMPKFSHRSIVNVTLALKRMGFDQLFARSADLKGINGAGHDLYLADMLQVQ